MFTDLWAPAQYVTGNTGAPGPARSPDNVLPVGGIDLSIGGPVNNQTSSDLSSVNVHLAGTIILALVAVFVLQQLGFRFVVAAGVGR